MMLYLYRCATCAAERVYTPRQHNIIASVTGKYLRERRELVTHCEPTPEGDGPAQLGHCLGHLWLAETLETSP